MMNNVIGSEILKIFQYVYVIDVVNDKVYSFSNGEVVTTSTFFDFMQSMTPLIHPNDVNNYFDNLSIQNIEKNNGKIIFDYRAKDNDGFVKYTNFSKIFTADDNKLVISASFKNEKNEDNTEFEQLKSRLSGMSFKVSDVIFKLYNALDVSLNEKTSDYIKTLLGQLINEFPEFDKQVQNDMISQVNRVKQSLIIIDDDAITRSLIKKTFKDEYDILMATNGQEAIDKFEEVGFANIVGIFLDILMPVVDGFGVLEYLKEKNVLSKIPVITISGAEDKATRQKVYQYNIADLLEKPFNLEIIKYRTKNLINLYMTSSSLNSMVLSQHTELLEIINRVVDSYKSDNNKSILKVREYFEIILKQVIMDYPEYKLEDYIVSKLLDASILYNVGIYILPKEMGKNGYYTKDEIELIKKHPVYASYIAKNYLSQNMDNELVKLSTNLLFNYYENYDGSGYPNGISGDNIPIYSQCLALAIWVYDIQSKNPGIDDNKIIELANKKSGTKYNPKLIDTLPIIINMLK